MSVSFSCHCEERKKPVAQRAWIVIARWVRCSAFDGYKRMRSNYSEVFCKKCRAMGRTKAAYVDQLPDAKAGEW